MSTDPGYIYFVRSMNPTAYLFLVGTIFSILMAFMVWKKNHNNDRALPVLVIVAFMCFIQFSSYYHLELKTERAIISMAR